MFEPVATLDDLWAGEKLGVSVRGRQVLLLNLDGRIVAFEDRCPHLGLALSHGELDGERLVCTGHRWEYDVSTGAGINPVSARLTPLRVVVECETIFVDVATLEDHAHPR